MTTILCKQEETDLVNNLRRHTVANVSVLHGERFETYDLDDGIKTVGDALEKFGQEDGMTFRVNGREVKEESDLRDGDTILIVSSKTASGGLKGATA